MKYIIIKSIILTENQIIIYKKNMKSIGWAHFVPIASRSDATIFLMLSFLFQYIMIIFLKRFNITCNGSSDKGIHLRGLKSTRAAEVPIRVEPVFLDADNRPAKVKVFRY